MAFTRDDMAAYEKQPQTQVADTQEHILKGATPYKTVAEAAAGETDATSAASADTDTNADPSGEGVESGDPSVTGDGTSDENADSSTASADPSGESEPTTEPVQQAPKKGSAAERIQELLDLTEGYKEYGKLKDGALKEALAELARLKAGSGTGTPSKQTTATTEPAADDDPMPDLSDKDVNYDTDKLRIKMQKWIDSKVEKGTTRVVERLTGKTEAQKLEAEVNAKVDAFAASHADWQDTVAQNQVLLQNQLSPDASLVVATSPHTADILYAFGKDPALAVRVSKLTPAQQIKEIGKVEAKIEAAKEAAAAVSTAKPANGSKQPVTGAKPVKQKSLTQAPPPPTAVKAAGRPTEREETDPDLSMDDFARRHREKKQTARTQMRKARGLG